MELEFDKEIDALLRKAERASPDAQAAPTGHLDADELAAFAENALPSSTRDLYVAHLADCDQCRRSLSAFVAATPAEMAVAMAASARAPQAVTATTIPWYRRLLTGQGLAYTMATLVILFSGVIGFLVYENQMAGRSSQVSQVRNEQPAPAAAPDHNESSSTNSAANAISNSTSSSPIESVTKTGVAIGSANVQTQSQPREEEKPSQQPATAVSSDAVTGASRADQTPATLPSAAAAPPPKDSSVTLAQRDAKSDAESVDTKKANGAVLDGVTAQRRVEVDRQQQSNAAKLKTRSIGPMAQNQSQNQIQNLPMAKSSPRFLNTREAGGKEFTFRDGTWYDTAYSGGGTKDVKRGTEKYLRLDAGLRNIADQIGGRIVIVWNGQAYKIK